VRGKRPGAPPAPATRDGLKPDPAEAQTAAEFIALLHKYRLWAGGNSYRKMSTLVDGRYSHTTFQGIGGKSATLPSLELTTNYIIGSGGDEADQDAWRTAWRRLKLNGAAAASDE
jgi:hypothetical protein